MKYPILILLLFQSCPAFTQKFAVGLKTGYSSSELSVKFKLPVSNESRNATMTPVHSIFMEWRASKYLSVETDLGYKTKQSYINLTWIKPPGPSWPPLLIDEIGELKMHQFFIGLSPRLRTDIGKRYFGYVQAGIVWSRTVYEAYPCCIDNRLDIGENLTTIEKSFGGGIGLRFQGSMAFALEFQHLSSDSGSNESYSIRPKVAFAKDLLFLAKFNFLVK
ncbi:MAG: hypothetical protein K9J37_14565 [Saprospiraceae bacterium]|nr:hypothetical protein [Saprospiraceae bacterium]MCF8251130.1 hypothetical protein [Saprospiraceae bacterium]MCF8282958.1 hypothetical protein [Bacteroidales bacterium]MCF8312912.1 hypothetical protein [Saprospiraceae bacterium]MCF8441389.1 hypothetical protein [Saprospiraceae bacterium]